jgi:MscS family membrane protein
LKAARKGDDGTAAQYLNTRLNGDRAAELAHQLFVVLDRRLPARLNELSDRPEGASSQSTVPNQNLVGTIMSPDGEVRVTVERLERGKAGSLWLFSRKTLQAIPDLYEEVENVPGQSVLPQFLATHIAGIRLIDWLALLGGLPLLYIATGLLGAILGSFVGRIRFRRGHASIARTQVLPKPIRLLIVAATIRFALTTFSMPLLARQFWSSLTALLIIGGCTWLLVEVNTWAEDRVRRRFERRSTAGAVSILRFIRRGADLVVLFIGLLVLLRYFNVNLTAALAGLGVGGIAVALAAQKTLENVIGGLSLVFDQTVRVGDFLGIGSASGTVISIGVRSTSLRTSDRTLVSVPNGQIANATLENFSLRDKFWFHHFLGLHYGTTASQVRSILESIRKVLDERSEFEHESSRAELVRFSASSLDLEIVAYCFARDWNHFLNIQGSMLLQVMDIVEENGAKIAIPAQTLYVAGSSGSAERGVRKVIASNARTAAAT